MSQNQLTQITSEALVQKLKQECPSHGIWVFDCDGTLIKGDIASLTAWGLIRFGLAHPDQLPQEWADYKNLPFEYHDFRNMRNKIIERKGINAIYEWETLLHTGLPPSASYDTACAVVKEAEKVGSLAFEKPLTDLAKHFAQNAWIVSGSPDICVRAVSKHLGIRPERVLGTRLETVDGIYAPRLEAPGVIWEELKRTVLRENGVNEPWLVAGDTIGDWQMMEMASHWCWACLWGKNRHRGEEFRKKIQEDVLGLNGPPLPEKEGFYIFEGGRHGPAKKWILEVKGAS